MRWIWIDGFIEFESGKSAKAIKNLSLAEDHFADHFPHYPIMPAALMLEGLAQTGGILVGEANNFEEKVILAKIPRANFRREAFAGETLTYEATVLDLREEGALIQGRIYASGTAGRGAELADCHQTPEHGAVPATGDELIGEAEIFFAHLDKNRSAQVFGDRNFVFSGELKEMLGFAKTLFEP